METASVPFSKQYKFKYFFWRTFMSSSNRAVRLSTASSLTIHLIQPITDLSFLPLLAPIKSLYKSSRDYFTADEHSYNWWFIITIIFSIITAFITIPLFT